MPRTVPEAALNRRPPSRTPGSPPEPPAWGKAQSAGPGPPAAGAAPTALPLPQGRGAGRSLPGPPSLKHLAELPLPLPGDSGTPRPARWDNLSLLNQHAFHFTESFQQQQNKNPVVFAFFVLHEKRRDSCKIGSVEKSLPGKEKAHFQVLPLCGYWQ